MYPGVEVLFFTGGASEVKLGWRYKSVRAEEGGNFHAQASKWVERYAKGQNLAPRYVEELL